MTKSKIVPFLPDEKSNHAIFWSLTKNEGVFSWLKGESPRHSRPALRNFTRRPTTSETGSRARSSSRNWGENRMQQGHLKGSSDSPEGQYRPAGRGRRADGGCPSYPQGGQEEWAAQGNRDQRDGRARRR